LIYARKGKKRGGYKKIRKTGSASRSLFLEKRSAAAARTAAAAGTAASGARIVCHPDHEAVFIALLGEEKVFAAELFVHELLQDLRIHVRILLVIKGLLLLVFTFFKTSAFAFD
jgi:hypothetical protein